jgi:acetyl-CoA C-acetyltransferase
MADVKNPSEEFDVVELNDEYAHQLPLWAEGLGLVEEGKAGQWLDSNGMEDQNVNLSGGMLNGNPMMLGGLARTVECVLQLRAEAEDRQVEGANKALAHSTTGAAGQHQGVVILEK